MKKRNLLITLIGLSFGLEAQITDTGSNVGIGTIIPNSQLHLASDSNHAFNMSRKNGTYGFKILRNAQDGNINFQIATGLNQWETKIKIGEGEGPNTKLLFNPDGGNVGIGTTNPDAKLAVNGKIHSKEVKVDLIGWSDFVFFKDYKLPTLKEVENHIKEKGHLKDIPSAKEVEKNGFFLGEMDAKLLQKIEELTLYTIEQEKKIEKIQKENKSLKTMNLKLIELQKRLEKLEKK